MNQPQSNWLKRHKFLSFGIIICTLIVVLISLKSMLATYFLRDFFEQHASDIAIEELTINLLGSDFTIKGLQTKHSNGQQLNIDSLYVDWQFDGLFENHITINELALDGVTIDIQSDQFVPLQIGPFLLSKFQSSASEPETDSETAEPWSIELNDIALSNLRLCLDDLTLLYEELGLPLTQKQQTLGVCFATDAIEITGAISVDKDQNVAYEDDISINGIAVTTTDDESLLTLNSLRLAELLLQTDQVSIARVQLNAFNLLAESEDASHAALGLSLDSLEVDTIVAKLDASEIGFNALNMKDLAFRTEAADKKIRPLTVIGELSLDDFNQSGNTITLANMSLAQVQLLSNFTNPQVNQEYLATLNNLSISGVDFKPTELRIIDIKLTNLESLLSINDQGLNFANWFQESTDNDAEPATNTETITTTELETESATTPMRLTVQSFTLEPANIRILESLTGSEYEHQIQDLSLTVQNISNDTGADTAPSTIKYTTGLGDSGTLNGEGTFKAIPDNLIVDITGKLKDMNLVGVSHLAARFIGYRIDSGLLNIDYRVAIKDQQIDSNLEALLEKFALAKLEASEQNPLNEDLGLPLPLALNLLRDSDNNIELDLPITGDINSPDFSVSGIISVVMVKAIKQAVIYNYSPLGMLSMASGIVDLATALRFEPVVFTPLSVEISEKGTEQLQKIITLMQKKPKVKMIICGVATEMDKPEQQAVEIAPNSANQVVTESSAAIANEPPAVQPIIDPMALISFAKQRQDSVINYIVDNGNIDKARLIGCNIKVAKKKDAKPEVKISI